MGQQYRGSAVDIAYPVESLREIFVNNIRLEKADRMVRPERLKADPIVRACCQDTPKSSKGIPTSVTSSPWRRRRYTIFARISRMRMVCFLYP